MEKSNSLRPVVSICISVHNTEKWLPRCLDSLVCQTLNNIEIIIVNNGSTDSSEDIMHKYHERYPNNKFTIVSQEDKGLAQGRQTGVNHATGEYVTFIDADDYVFPNTYKRMYDCAITNNCDIVEIQTFREGKVLSSPYIGLHDSHEILKDFFLGKGVLLMLWLRMYRRSLFTESIFPSLYTNNEDNFVLPCLLYRGSSIYFINEPLHVYSTDNENAIMLKLITNKKMTDKLFYARKQALKSLPHIEQFIGFNILQNLYPVEYIQYKRRCVQTFINQYISRYWLNQRLDAVIETLGFEQRKDVIFFLKEQDNNFNYMFCEVAKFRIKYNMLFFKQLVKKYFKIN